MRFIFLLLFVLNIVYLYYNLNKNTENFEKVNLNDEKGIILLSESPYTHERSQLADTPIREAKQQQNSDAKIATIKKQLLGKGQAQSEQLIGSPAIKSNDRVAVDDEAIVLDSDDEIEQLYTAVELQSESIIKNAHNKKVAPEITPMTCYTIGPTSHPKKLAALQEKIRDLIGAVNFSTFEEKGITFYRIFIPPLNSNVKIRRAQTILNENNLKDHYVMNSSGRKNAIALGVFRVKRIADSIAKKVRGLGYRAVVEPIFESNKVQYYLKITTSTSLKNSLLNKKFLQTDLEINLCKKNEKKS